MDALSRETIIVAMAKALESCPVLAIKDARRHAYLKAKISEGNIRAFDRDAVHNAEIHRKLWPAKVPGMAGIVARIAATACLFIVGMAMFCVDPACAATEIVDADWSSSFLNAGAWIGGIALGGRGE